MDPVVGVVELYGVGTRYDVPVEGRDSRLSVVVRRDGQRDLYVFAGGAGDEPTTVVPLSEEQARLLSAVLAGTYFHVR